MNTGGYTALATKGVSSMLSSTLWRAFATPVTYVLIFILLGTAIMQIRYVNKALQRFDSTQVIPIQFVMFTLCVILGSAVLYRDFEKTTAEQAGKFVGGCLLTFFGVFLITSGRGQSEDDDDALSDIEGVEETISLAHQEGNPQGSADQQSITTPLPRSRRSSKHSRAGYFEPVASSPLAEDDDTPLFHPVGHGSTPSSVGPESASLLGNRWVQPQATTPPGRGIRTMSADSLMTGAAVLAPSRSHPVTPMRDVQAMPGYQPDQLLTPQNRANTIGPGQHHRTGTFISPSPLASTVTTVMKDGILRDKQALAQKSSVRHIRSRIRASLFFNEDGSGVAGPAGVPTSEDNLARGVHQEDNQSFHETDGNEDYGRMRSRSLSDALGDLFKPKKRRTGEADADVERADVNDTLPGPSN